MRATGRLLSVSESPVGTTLAEDAAASAESITVDDASVFDEGGGWLYIGSQVVAYTGYDDETGVVTLADPLDEAADEDDSVVRWSALYQEVETAQSAQVAVLGDRDQADTLDAEVADWVDLENGDRGQDGENCVIELDGDVWTLISAKGRPSKARGLKHEPNDPHTLTSDEIAAGLFTHQLAHAGIAYDRAIMCFVNGIAYGPDQLAVDSESGIVDVTLGGWETTDNADIWFDYWYRRGPVAAPIPETPTWDLAAIVTDYTDTAGVTHFPSGPLTGSSIDDAEPGVTGFNGDYNVKFVLPEDFGDESFATKGIVGLKIVGQADGTGIIGFNITLDNPGATGAPEWPDGNASGSSITLDSYWGDGTEGCIQVDGPTDFEHVLAVNATASDPYYEGFNYDDILGKLEVSIRSTTGGFPHLIGEVQGAGGSGDAVTIKDFKLVLIGTPA